MSKEIKTVDCGNFVMDYFCFGKGRKTMVILPGLSVQSVMLSAETVIQEYEVMKDDFTVYVFDRRRELPETYAVTEMAEDTVKAIEKLDLHDLYLFGASQGGMMAMYIAVNYPKLVRKLAVASTCGKVDAVRTGTITGWIEKAQEGNARELFLAFGKGLYPDEIYQSLIPMADELARGVTAEDLQRFITLANGTAGFDVLRKLDTISCPTLVIHSRDDMVLGGDAGREIVSHNQEFRLHEYENYGHACYDTAPDCRKILYDFMMEQ